MKTFLRTRAYLRPTSAFTLIELLTVIAIIGILAAITLAAISRVRAQAIQARCGSNIRQIQALAAVWAQDNQDWCPQAMWAQSDEYFKSKGQTARGLRSNGFTDSLGKCGAAADGGTEAPHYGINNNLVSGGPDGQWGRNSVQYWVHGRYKFSAILSSRTIVFTETARSTANPGSVPYTTGAGVYMSSDEAFAAAAPRHNGKAFVSYADGHIALLTPDYLKNTIPKPWIQGITQ